VAPVVRWCFHATAMVADYERSRDALIRIAGLRVLEDGRLEDPAIGRRGGMAWLGDNIIEVGEPIVEGGAVDRFVRRFGSHTSSIALQVDDMEATLGHLAALGVAVASRPEPHIVFTSPTGTEGIVFEWFSDHEALDPRFGGPLPPKVEALLDVTEMAFCGVVVPDPAAAARRFATLFGRPVTFLETNAAPGDPWAGVSMGDSTLALYPLPPATDSPHLWGWTYQRAQTNCVGVRVPDLSLARSSLDSAGVPIVRTDERTIVIHPDATGGVILVVVDELLPGDPRMAT
jgi:catechol 2,3-dioxygenase-like lactoylglutathione lyase family enzyme